MTVAEFSAQLAYASVDDRAGGDPRPKTLALLREMRVLSALRDASAPWSDAAQEAVAEVAVSDDGFVLTLTAEDTITRELTVADLRARFADAGLALWLEDPASDGDLVDEGDTDLDDTGVFEPDDATDGADDDVDLDELFAVQPVRVRVFSRRGPIGARVAATQAGAEAHYAEVSDWSLVSYQTTESTSLWQPSKAESPVIVVNIPADGDPWVEVTPHGITAVAVPFWPNIERDTVPALELDAITVPAAAETYRMLLTEGDGVRDELEALAAQCDLDVELAHQSLRAEALGGVKGADARIRSFLRAFDVPETLIEAAMSDAGAAALAGTRRFSPKSWPCTAGDVILGGTWEATALPRRGLPWARLSKAVQDRPALAAVIAVSEVTLGVVLTMALRRGGKVVGGVLIADGLGDLAVLFARMRRR